MAVGSWGKELLERQGVAYEERQHPEFITSQDVAVLIVMSTPGSTGPGRMLMGSVAEAESTARGPVPALSASWASRARSRTGPYPGGKPTTGRGAVHPK